MDQNYIPEVPGKRTNEPGEYLLSHRHKKSGMMPL